MSSPLYFLYDDDEDTHGKDGDDDDDDDAEEKDGYGKGISRDKWCDPTVDLAGLGLQCFWTT